MEHGCSRRVHPASWAGAPAGQTAGETRPRRHRSASRRSRRPPGPSHTGRRFPVGHHVAEAPLRQPRLVEQLAERDQVDAARQNLDGFSSTICFMIRS